MRRFESYLFRLINPGIYYIPSIVVQRALAPRNADVATGTSSVQTDGAGSIPAIRSIFFSIFVYTKIGLWGYNPTPLHFHE